MMILSIGLLGMLMMQIYAMKSGRVGRHVTEAARIANDQMEQLQRQSWAATAPTAFTAPIIVNGNESTDAAGIAIAQPFNLSWQIVPFAGVASLRQIEVVVTWQEPGDDPAFPPRRYATTSVRYNGPGTPP